MRFRLLQLPLPVTEPVPGLGTMDAGAERLR